MPPPPPLLLWHPPLPLSPGPNDTGTLDYKFPREFVM